MFIPSKLRKVALELEPIDNFSDSAERENYRHRNYEFERNYDKNCLVDFNRLVEEYVQTKPDSGIGKTEIQRYVENGYFADLYFEDGEKGFLIDGPGRINLIYRLANIWGYNTHELKSVAEGEDAIIFNVLTSSKTDYPDCNSDEFLVLHNHEMIEVHKTQKTFCKSFAEKRKHNKAIKDYEKSIKFLEHEKFDSRPVTIQKKINDEAFVLAFSLTLMRFQTIESYRSKLLLGFHPHIMLAGECVSSEKIKDKKIRSEYDYMFNENGGWYYYKKVFDHSKSIVNFNPTEQLFYATPEFYVGFRESGNIQIEIRDPKAVTSNCMRDVIGRVYTKFRSSLNIKRTDWGSKTGTRKKIKQRDEELKRLYNSRREAKPSVAADRTLENVLKEISPKYGDVSLERAKRIIYSK